MFKKLLFVITSIALAVSSISINVSAADNVDVAITVSADKSCYGEGQIISYEINYKNRIDTAVKEPVIRAQIPENTSIVGSSGDYLGNYLREGNEVKWILDTINPFSSGRIIYQVKVNELPQAEMIVANNVRILANNAVNGTDDMSEVNVMLFSDKYPQLYHEGFIKGYSDNTFRPSNNVTRAEASAILVRVLKLKVTDLSRELFKDIPKNHWAFEYITAVNDAGIFTGYRDETFRPDETITREELATAIFRALKLPDVTPVVYHFTDINQNTPSKNYIEEVYRLKIINGYNDGSFKPYMKVTRAEMIAIINRMLYRGPLAGGRMTFTDVPPSHWAYGMIAESTNDHNYLRRPDKGEVVNNK